MVMLFTVAALNQKQGGMSTGKTAGSVALWWDVRPLAGAYVSV